MAHDLEDTLALLSRTPATLYVLLRDMPDVWTERNEGGSSWTASQVVAHLISGERVDWIPRAKTILEHGESRAFEPFDREGFRRETEGKSLNQLLDEFARLRAENIGQVRSMNLTAADLTRRGKHPSLGAVTLSELLATWAGHDLTHLHQLSRILAHQYREEVGPWGRYLGVLQCQGHSADS